MIDLDCLSEPPYTERYVRWCERSVVKLINHLLLDYQPPPPPPPDPPPENPPPELPPLPELEGVDDRVLPTSCVEAFNCETK